MFITKWVSSSLDRFIIWLNDWFLEETMRTWETPPAKIVDESLIIIVHVLIQRLSAPLEQSMRSPHAPVSVQVPQLHIINGGNRQNWPLPQSKTKSNWIWRNKIADIFYNLWGLLWRTSFLKLSWEARVEVRNKVKRAKIMLFLSCLSFKIIPNMYINHLILSRAWVTLTFDWSWMKYLWIWPNIYTSSQSYLNWRQ